MDNKKYIILEIIPSAVDPKKGNIVQLSALKINGYKLESRFDYRLCEENNSLNKESYIYLIKGDGSKNCPNLIIDFKNLFRKKHSSVRIQKPLGNGYKVKINIIHSPLPIENENHLKAIKNYIILE